VSGTSDIPWNNYLKAAGWRLALTKTPAVDARIGSIPPAVPGGRWRAVAPLGAAWLAGLRTGDELVRINRRDIIDGTDVTAAVRSIRPGTTVIVDVMRNNQPITIRFHAGRYEREHAALRDLSVQTTKMRRIRAGLTGATP